MTMYQKNRKNDRKTFEKQTNPTHNLNVNENNKKVFLLSVEFYTFCLQARSNVSQHMFRCVEGFVVFFLSIFLFFFFFEKCLYLPAVSEHFKLFNVVELFGHSEIVRNWNSGQLMKLGHWSRTKTDKN